MSNTTGNGHTPSSALSRRRLLATGGAGLAATLLAADGTAAATTTPATPPTPPVPTFLPVPDFAQIRDIPKKGYLVEAIGVADGAYQVTDGIYNTVFFVVNRRVVVVDAPFSLGTRMLDAIAEVTRSPVTHAIYSHSHNDHVGAMGIYGTDVTYIAHADTVPLLRRKAARLPLPQRTWTGRRPFELQVDSLRLRLTDQGRAHQPGNLFVWSNRHKVVMTVDIAFPDWAPFKNLAIAADVLSIPQAVDALQEYPFAAFIGGHFDSAADRTQIEVQREYLADLFAASQRANQLVSYPEATAVVDPANIWGQFDTYADAVSRTAAALMPTYWADRLGGSDVFLEDNAFVVTEAYRIDG